jgi:CheY-like chemotaxis protein
MPLPPGQPDSLPLLLLIDDHDDTRVPAGQLLETCGFRVELAAGGDEGVAKAVSLSPAVIVTDVVMPQVSGFEVCARLKADPGTRGIPIIVYTALTDRAALARLQKVGVDVFAIKPCLPTVVGREALALIEQHGAPRTADRRPRVVTGYGETINDLFDPA